MTLDEILTPERKETWRRYHSFTKRIDNNFPKLSLIGDPAGTIRDLVALVIEQEFKREHRLDGRRYLVWCLHCSYGDVHRSAPPDPRHNNQWPDWQRAAEERLNSDG